MCVPAYAQIYEFRRVGDTAHVWKSKNNFQCQSSSSTFFETYLLSALYIKLVGLGFRPTPVSPQTATPGSQMLACTPRFISVLEI